MMIAAGSASAQDLVVGSGMTFTLTGTSSYVNVDVQAGGTLVLDGTLNASGNVTVRGTGRIIQSLGTPQVVITAPNGTVDVQVGATINLSGLGLLGGYQAGNTYGCSGQTLNPSSFLVVQGAGQYQGGVHGGVGSGASAALVFGFQDAPAHRGGGGGCGASSANRGGNGGGALRISAQTIRIDGAVRVDGAAGVAGSGEDGAAGAGGSIHLTGGALVGGGTLSAAGGTSGDGSGGGGGRIAITTATHAGYTGTLTTAGGAGGGGNGSVGSAWLLDLNDALDLQGGYVELGPGASVASATFGPGGVLRIEGNATITAPLTISQTGLLVLNTADALSNITLSPIVDGQLQVNAPLTLPAGLIVNGTATFNQPITIPGDFTVAFGGRVTHAAQQQAGVQITATDGGTIDVRGAIDTNGMGLPSGRSIDPNTGLVVNSPGQYGGGSHGGRGGGANANPVYDLVDAPTKLGSGGGQGAGSGNPGGAGGGRIQLTCAVLRLDGSLTANGLSSPNNSGGDGGGGSGGTVFITAGTLSGSGTISASGGNSTDGSGGGGGGGRIAIDYGTNTFTGSVVALGGTGSAAGQPGSARLLSTGGALTVQNGTYVLTGASSFQSVTLGGNAVLEITGAASVATPIQIAAATTVDLRAADALMNVTLGPIIAGRLIVNAATALPAALTVTGRLTVNRPVTVMGDLTLAVGSTLDADARITTCDVTVSGVFDVRGTINLTGRGHPPGMSPDPVTQQIVSNVPALQGGSHGGRGGGATPRAVYGDQDDPDDLGSGGGFGSNGASTPGGSGGGRIRIVAGTLRLDGSIIADGTDALLVSGPADGGGGAGGSINITATTFEGMGLIAARGGRNLDSCCGGGFGGAGGRIAVNYTTSTFTGTLTATPGSAAAGAGNEGTARMVSAARALTVHTGYYELLGSHTYDSATILPSGTLVLAGPGTVTQPLAIPAGTRVRVTAPNGAQSVTLPAAVAGSLWVEAPFNWAGPHTVSGVLWVRQPTTTGALTLNMGSTATVDAALQVTGDVIVSGGATMTHTAGVRAFDLTSTGRITVAMGGLIEASARGLPGGNGGSFGCNGTALHPTTLMQVSGSGTGTGGSFGGLGFGASPNLVYGSAIDLEYPGSGGGCGSSTVGGGRGGGLLRLRAAVLEVQGSVLANGGATSSGGGGSGGAIKIAVNQVEGTGAIRANGGAASATSGGGGGGGRIRIDQAMGMFMGVVETLGGVAPSGRSGANGAVSVVTTPPGSPMIQRGANLVAAVGRPYLFDVNGRVEAAGMRPMTFAKDMGPPNLFVDAVTGRVTWTPSGPGLVTVAVKATNMVGTDVYPFAVDVTASPPAGPMASIAPGTFSGPGPFTVPFDGSGSTGAAALLAYDWDFGDGQVAEGAMVSHTFTACGGYVTRLTVTDVYGQTSTASQLVSVACNGMNPPRAKIVATLTPGSGTTEASFSCECAQGSAAITGYQWLATDGLFSDQPMDMHAFGPGTHTLQLIVVDANGLSAIDRLPITVADTGNNQPPFARAYATPSAGPAPLTVQLGADYGDPDGTIASAGWTFSDGTMAMEHAPMKTFTTPALERAIFTATDLNGLTAQAFVDINVTGAGGERPTEILSMPRTSVLGGDEYTYDKDGLPTVRGQPPFSYALTAAPMGATIDASTGRIAWPTASVASGDYDFTLTVTGAGGPAAQTWKVAVTGGGSNGPGGGGCKCDAGGGLVLLLGLVPMFARARRRARTR